MKVLILDVQCLKKRSSEQQNPQNFLACGAKFAPPRDLKNLPPRVPPVTRGTLGVNLLPPRPIPTGVNSTPVTTVSPPPRGWAIKP